MRRARMCESDEVEKMAFFVEERKGKERRGGERRGKARRKEVTFCWLGGGRTPDKN
jgi:hypothetical protein